jgi:hypothetical protein
MMDNRYFFIYERMNRADRPVDMACVDMPIKYLVGGKLFPKGKKGMNFMPELF